MRHPMKYQLLSLLLLSALPQSALANSCGGSCSGGGGRIRSTEAEVRAAIDNVKDRMFEFNMLYGLRYQAFNPTYAQDPALKRMLGRLRAKLPGSIAKDPELLEKMYPDPLFGAALVVEAAKSRFVPKKECRDHDGTITDASTQFKTGADVCFNLTTLQSLPPEEMRVQVWALAYHELGHHRQRPPVDHEEREKFEEEGRALQKHVKSVFGNLFSEFGRAATKGAGNTFELVPGGWTELPIKVKTAAGETNATVKVSCDTQLDPTASTVLGNLQMEPGRTLSAKGPDGALNRVVCLNLPRVRCTLKKTGQNSPSGDPEYAIKLGEFTHSTASERSMNFLTKEYEGLKRSGICESVEQAEDIATKRWRESGGDKVSGTGAQ